MAGGQCLLEGARHPSGWRAARRRCRRRTPQGKKGSRPVHDDVKVAAATLQGDGKTVFLSIPDLAPVMQMKIKFDFDAADGSRVRSEIYSSIHKLPGK